MAAEKDAQKKVTVLKSKMPARQPDLFVQVVDIAKRIPVGPVVFFVLALLLISALDENLWKPFVPAPQPLPACGDNVCSSSEYARDSCPQDCRKATETITATEEPLVTPTAGPLDKIKLENEDNRFGFSAVPQDVFLEGKLAEAGVKWVLVDANPQHPNREEIKRYLESGINVAVRLELKNAKVGNTELSKFTREFGSGKGPYIKYYIIPDSDLQVVKTLRKAILEGCPACKIGVEVDAKMLEKAEPLTMACSGPCFDILAFQYFDNENTSQKAYLGMKEYADAAKKMLQAKKVKASLWLTGTGAYGGRFGEAPFRRQDSQAIPEYKMLSFAVVNGFEKVFAANPAGCLGGEESYFCSIALVDLLAPRQAFTTFKLVRNALDEASFEKEIAGPRPDTKAFAFTTPAGRAYTVWGDDFREAFRSIGLPVQSARIRITDIATGQTAERDVTGNLFSITLKENAVLVEELAS